MTDVGFAKNITTIRCPARDNHTNNDVLVLRPVWQSNYCRIPVVLLIFYSCRFRNHRDVIKEVRESDVLGVLVWRERTLRELKKSSRRGDLD